MRKKQNLVSVLLSIYNVDDYLEECLDSILGQSYKNLEVVCVNNGSPDRCGEILKKYAKKDERIKIVTLKENKMLCGGLRLHNASRGRLPFPLRESNKLVIYLIYRFLCFLRFRFQIHLFLARHQKVPSVCQSVCFL